MNNFKKIYLIGSVAMLFLTIACQKDESEATPETTQIENYKVLRKYLSVSFGIDEKQIKFNSAEQSFYVPNTVFSMPLKTVTERYALANEYNPSEQ